MTKKLTTEEKERRRIERRKRTISNRREYERIRNRLPHRRAKQKIRHTIRMREYSKIPKNRILNVIRTKTLRYFKDKKIKCANCDSTNDLQFHHLKPFAYDNFLVLCRRHHLEQHGKEKRQ